MTVRTLGAARVRHLVSSFAGLPVLVVGDLMLDRFIVGRVTRISPEAPVPVVRFQSEHARLGGAANVAQNIASLGGRVMLVGLVGRDRAADRLRQELAAAGIATDALIEDPSRRTTEKVRIVTERNQQVARLDYEQDDEVDQAGERAISDTIAQIGSAARALLVSDYLKGVVTRRVVEALLGLNAQGPVGPVGKVGLVRPLIVDPKIPHLACYAGATLITPNHHEAEIATLRRIRTGADAHDAARELRRRVGCEAALITLGESGMWLSSPECDEAIPAVAREVADVTGAGDTVAATLALALAAGATMPEAAILANHAAGIVVGKFGPAAVTPDELIATF